MLGKSTGITITIGRNVLGSPIGSPEFIVHFVRDRIEVLVSQISNVSDIAASHTQSAFFPFSNKWTYLSRTCLGINHLFQPLKDAIRLKLIPAITGLDFQEIPLFF